MKLQIFQTKSQHTSHQLIWWLVTESNRVHWLFRPTLSRRVPEPNLVDGARLELALHGCRPWVIPLYEPPIWGDMRESNSRDWSHNPAPKPFGHNPAIEFGAAGWISTSIDMLTRQVPLYVGHSSKLMELARSLEL